MILRTILFFLLMYLLIKVISRLFLPSKTQQQNKSKSGPGFFYRMYQQQQNAQRNQQNAQNNKNNGPDKRFEQIEEAEFEDITEEEKSN